MNTEYTSMNKESKKPKTSEMLKIFKENLRSAELQRRDLDGKIEKWANEQDGKPYGNEVKGRSSIVSRDGKRQSEWQHATLIDPFVSSNDIVKGAPISFEDRSLARQQESVLTNGSISVACCHSLCLLPSLDTIDDLPLTSLP